jgi:hypothetical protein
MGILTDRGCAFDKLRRLCKDTARINHIVEEEFEQVEAEDRL